MQSLARRQAMFTLGMLVCGGIEAAIAYGVVGLRGVEGVAYSGVLCLIPGWLTIYASDLMRHAGVGAYVVLVGTSVRMLFVLAGVFAIRELRADLGFREFTAWLIINYLVSLGLETWMVLAPSEVEPAKS